MIETLTSAQELTLASFRQHWFGISLSTETIDRYDAQESVRELYRAAGVLPPNVHFFDSPHKAMARQRTFAGFNTMGGRYHDFGSALRMDLYSRCVKNLGLEVWGKLALQLYWPLRLLRRNEVIRDIGADFIPGQSADFLGAQSSYWISFYVFAVEELALRVNSDVYRSVQSLKAYAHKAGWMFPYQRTAFVCDRPAAIHLDNYGLLHHATGPAIEWRDGSGIYAWHGVVIPKWAVMEPDRLNPQSIAAAPRDDLRTALFEIWASRNDEPKRAAE